MVTTTLPVRRRPVLAEENLASYARRPKALILADYVTLRKRVRQAMALGRERAKDAVEREKVRTAWTIGKLIHDHILLNKKRADYGKKVIYRLSADLAISNTELYYMVEFVRTHPNFRPAGNLSWSHYQALLRINDSENRKALAKQAARENWTRTTLRREIGKLKAENPAALRIFPTDEPLVPIKGLLDTYRIVIAETGPWQRKPVVDLGFANYYRPHEGLAFGKNEIIRVSEEGKLEPAKDASGVDLFTYRAYVLEVTDGDTLWVLVDLGFGFTTKQQLRLRGLDAPEIATRDGAQAKRFIEKELRKHAKRSTPYVIITSTKSDKYDRYLADVFYETKDGEQFLNNRLLDKKLAQRV